MQDPICKMEVGVDARFRSSYKGKTFYFCSEACKQRFDKKPESFAKG